MLRVHKFGSTPLESPIHLGGLCGLYDEPGFAVSPELETHLSAADGYIVYPHSDPLLTLSLLVAKQYNPLYANKPVAMLHSESAPNPYVALVRHLQSKGVVTQAEDTLYALAEHAADAERILQQHALDSACAPVSDAELIAHQNPACPARTRPAFNVCVIGSYSTKDPAHTQMATEIGAMLHNNRWGLVYGGSDKGMMGAFAKAAKGADRSGYVEAVIPKLYLRDGLDAEMHDFIDQVHVTSDIYLRMNHMTKQSDIFLAAPGGLGTAQEIAAFLRIKQADPAQAHKPLVLLNEDGFWNPMVNVLAQGGYTPGTDFMVASSLAEVEELMHAAKARANARAA